MGYKIGICDRDSHYIVCLMEYINTHKDIPLRLSVFSGEKAVREYISYNHLDLLLVGDDMTVPTEMPCAVLTGKRELAHEEACIYKYQSVEKIAERIMCILAKSCTRLSERCLVYGIYSPVARCGKTSLAMGICTYYGKSLYVGMEEYAGISQPAEMNGCSELFFYYFMSRSDEIVNMLAKLTESETGITVVAGAECYMDYRQLTAEDMQWLCSLLRERQDYRRVVFDVGTGSLTELGSLCFADRIFVPVLRDEVSERKLANFKGVLVKRGYEQLIERITYVEIPDAAYDSADMKRVIEGSGM